jgi:hypothetical protein
MDKDKQDKFKQTCLQWLKRLKWGVTFSQVVCKESYSDAVKQNHSNDSISRTNQLSHPIPLLKQLTVFSSPSSISNQRNIL